MRRHSVLILSAVAAFLPTPALAQELFAGLLAHDVHLPIDKGGYQDGAEVEVGYRSAALRGLGFLGRPSLYVRGAVAASGGTDFISAGLSWRLGRGPVYVRPALGIAVQTGDMPVFGNGVRQDLGSRLVFEPEAAIGYRIAPRVSIEATLVHRSHAGLFNSRQNPGMDSVGLRLNFGL